MTFKTINLTSRAYDNLESFPLEKGIIATEGEFKIYNDQLLKRYFDNSKGNLKRKIHTLALLNDHKEEINIPELIIPDTILLIDDKPCGIGKECVPGTNTEILISSKQIPNEIKIKILKQIGSIIHKVSEHYNDLSMAFGDLHIGNFIYNGKETFAVDTESMKILDNEAAPSRYMRTNPNLDLFNQKYPYNVYGVNISNSETDLFCFVMMVVNFISKNETYKLSLEKYFDYLDYLKALGIDDNLIKSFASIYSLGETIDPTLYLDTLVDIPKEASYRAYKAKVKR